MFAAVCADTGLLPFRIFIVFAHLNSLRMKPFESLFSWLNAQRSLRSIAAVCACLGLGTIGFGYISLAGPVKEVDTFVYTSSLDYLQRVPWLIEISEYVTDLGSMRLNWLLAIAAGFIFLIRTRRITLATLTIATFVALIYLQKIAIAIVGGSRPEDIRIIGESGPYFSGGVARVIVLTGILTLVARRQTTSVRSFWVFPIALGTIEAITRLALGRHWPIDIVAAFPIGLTILWLFHQALLHLDYPAQSTTSKRTSHVAPPSPPSPATNRLRSAKTKNPLTVGLP